MNYISHCFSMAIQASRVESATPVFVKLLLEALLKKICLIPYILIFRISMPIPRFSKSAAHLTIFETRCCSCRFQNSLYISPHQSSFAKSLTVPFFGHMRPLINEMRKQQDQKLGFHTVYATRFSTISWNFGFFQF